MYDGFKLEEDFQSHNESIFILFLGDTTLTYLWHTSIIHRSLRGWSFILGDSDIHLDRQ